MTQTNWPFLVTEQLRDAIRFHAYLYYVLDKPCITDATWDKMFAELKRIEEKNPLLLTPDSPTQLVGADMAGPLKDRR